MICGVGNLPDNIEATGKSALGLVGANSHDITWMVSQFIYTYGGELMDCTGEEILIGSLEAADGIDFYKNVLGNFAQEGWVEDTGVEVMEAFAAGDIAFEIQGPWGISDVWKKGFPFEVGVIPLSDIGVYSEVGPMMLSMVEGSHSNEAETFIRYMTSIESLEKIMEGEYEPKYDAYYPFRVPLRKDMESSAFFEKYPEFLSFIEGFKLPSINTPCEAWYEIQQNVYPDVLHRIMTDEISIEEGLKEVSQ